MAAGHGRATTPCGVCVVVCTERFMESVVLEEIRVGPAVGRADTQAITM
jgi:hypothetical protein